LDSTNPLSVIRLEKTIKLTSSLFIVASKSGGTTETNMFYQYFFDEVAKMKKGANAGDNFIAVTDAHTKMETIAREKQFRKIFLNPADIGGRYSALSYFGLVPMALIGMDIRAVLDHAKAMAVESRLETAKNPPALLGAALGVAARAGFDKLTFITSHEVETFANWVEQLVAESTGKEGKGIIPIEGEPFDLALDTAEGSRFFIIIALKADLPNLEDAQRKISTAGYPMAMITLDSANELGGEFFRWEFATAVSAALLQINPFDEPNVKESKDNTVRVISEYQSNGKLPVGPPVVQEDGISIFCTDAYRSTIMKKESSGIKEMLNLHFQQAKKTDYIAILAYVDQNKNNDEMLLRIRGHISRKTGCAVTIGYGPRYLHSTGQLHKGGAPKGKFLILTTDEADDRAIPGEKFTFKILKQAQALGDYQSLAARHAPVLHIHFDTSELDSLHKLASLIDG
jgi:transaldolase/glucose-6-phosphate isomerase